MSDGKEAKALELLKLIQQFNDDETMFFVAIIDTTFLSLASREHRVKILISSRPVR